MYKSFISVCFLSTFVFINPKAKWVGYTHFHDLAKYMRPNRAYIRLNKSDTANPPHICHELHDASSMTQLSHVSTRAFAGNYSREEASPLRLPP